MVLSHLFAFCKDAVCVAEDSSVAFYAVKSLKKFCVERLSGARIAGLYVATGASGELNLHVVDAEANWFLISLSHIELLASSSIKWGDEFSAITRKKPVVLARRSLANQNNLLNKHSVLEAHFHEAGGSLHCVLLDLDGVYEASLQDTSAIIAEKIMSFPSTLSECTLAIGQKTGLVLVGQSGGKWAKYSFYGERDVSKVRDLPLSINIQSLACSPVASSVAVGGTRGELVVYPSVIESHHFSDHWHHTPLVALSFSLDGNSLFTAAGESVLLVWNMSSFTYRKIGCGLGPIRCITSSCSKISQLLLTAAESTLATLDLLQMRVDQFVEGVQWSTGQVCRGLVVGRWMGQTAVILTGLPNVVRICDPLTQQAFYSLYISFQMETIPNPPRHGIQHVGLLNDNRTIVTYEEFGNMALPPLLRFWVYDKNTKRHIETQTIYSPHESSRIIALQMDDLHQRVFTLCANSMKCWGEVSEDANDAYAIGQKSWMNKSSCQSPSRFVQDMLLSSDASLCFVSDDSIHIYSVTDLYPGRPWSRLFTLTQSVSLTPLKEMQLLTESRVLVAHDGERVYFWSLASPRQLAVHWAAGQAGVTTLCSFTATTVLAATSDGGLWELCGVPGQMGAVVGQCAPTATPRRITHMRCLPGPETGQVAAVDEVSGFRVLYVPPANNNNRKTEEKREMHVELFEGSKIRVGSLDDSGERQINDFFRNINNDNKENNAVSEAFFLNTAARVTGAKKWLLEVLADSTYTAPPMSSVLSSYLAKRAGVSAP